MSFQELPVVPRILLPLHNIPVLSNYTELQVQKVTRSQYCTCVDVKYAYKIYQYKNNRKKQSIQE